MTKQQKVDAVSSKFTDRLSAVLYAQNKLAQTGDAAIKEELCELQKDFVNWFSSFASIAIKK